MYYKDNVTRKVDSLQRVTSFKKIEVGNDNDATKVLKMSKYGNTLGDAETYGKGVPSITDSPVRKNPKPFEEKPT